MTVYFCCGHGDHFRTKAVHLKAKKVLLCREMLLCQEKYLLKLKQHGLLNAFISHELRVAYCFYCPASYVVMAADIIP